MGDINMKKLNKAQLRKIILQEMHDLEEAKLGGRAEAFLKDKVKFGGAAAKALNYLMGTGFFEEMMKEVEAKLSQTLTPDAILRVKMAMKDYIDFELGDIDMAPAPEDSDGMAYLDSDGVDVDDVYASSPYFDDSIDLPMAPTPSIDNLPESLTRDAVRRILRKSRRVR